MVMNNVVKVHNVHSSKGDKLFKDLFMRLGRGENLEAHTWGRGIVRLRGQGETSVIGLSLRWCAVIIEGNLYRQ